MFLVGPVSQQLCRGVCVLQVLLLSSKMGSQGAKDIPAGGGLVRALPSIK